MSSEIRTHARRPLKSYPVHDLYQPTAKRDVLQSVLVLRYCYLAKYKWLYTSIFLNSDFIQFVGNMLRFPFCNNNVTFVLELNIKVVYDFIGQPSDITPIFEFY